MLGDRCDADVMVAGAAAAYAEEEALQHQPTQSRMGQVQDKWTLCTTSVYCMGAILGLDTDTKWL